MFLIMEKFVNEFSLGIYDVDELPGNLIINLLFLAHLYGE